MNTKKILFAVLLSLCLLPSCVSQQTPEPQKPNLAGKYIITGESYEAQGRLQSALEQYELALTVDPKNPSALDHKKKVESVLYEKARQHYEKGLALDEQGLYDSARRQYLSALQNWPDYTPAKEKLSPGGVSLDSKDYILHTLLGGQSVSKLSLIYYGDLKYYPIIGKFNNMVDVTRVRAGEQLKIPALNGLTVEDLKKKYQAYMKGRRDMRGEQTGPSQPEVMAPAAPAELPQEPVTPEVPEPNTPPQAPEAPDVAEPSDVTEIPPPSPEVPESVPDERSTPVPAVETPNDYDQAMVLFQQKKYSQAIPLFKKAQIKDPDNEQIGANLFESYFQQGLTQFKKEQYLDARQSFSSAMQYNDDACSQCRTYIKTCEDTYKEKHYNLGIHYFGKEQLELAINEWELVEKIDPGYKDVQSNLKKARTLYERLESIKQSNTQ
ncbi:tetratricopeptide repeat protein [Desulfobacter curvatus]|uniref:tetratricopeptide repeat protein n=1 Tax=Desulfobacter curvatus TaxID=2290 RepID=UPI000370B43F|nr:tetratricopeptide repeat protein [Desulfobacter curvatus]